MLFPRRCSLWRGKYASGPNCWGATLLFHGVYKKARFVGVDEMEDWLEKKCFEIDDDNVRWGDILVMRGGYEELIHTAVFLNKNRYWHKDGMNGTFAIVNKAFVYNAYPETHDSYFVRYSK